MGKRAQVQGMERHYIRKVKLPNTEGRGAGVWGDQGGAWGWGSQHRFAATCSVLDKTTSIFTLSMCDQRVSESRERDAPTCPFQHLLQLPGPCSESGPLKARQRRQFGCFAPC